MVGHDPAQDEGSLIKQGLVDVGHFFKDSTPEVFCLPDKYLLGCLIYKFRL
jgi:hypothetical protein